MGKNVRRSKRRVLPSNKKGRLTVVGTGIKSVSHITIEVRSAIRSADKVLYLTADVITDQWLRRLNPSTEDLHRFYADGRPRQQSYDQMCEYILLSVRRGLWVCAAFYGHPGVFVAPGHAAITKARQGGFAAEMLPGISAEDCLFADLGVDPARSGCQSFEATDFLVYRRLFDPRCTLILWQVGVVAHFDYQGPGYKNKGFTVLVNYLRRFYPQDHEVVIYEAATYAVCPPRVDRVRLRDLRPDMVSTISTLFIPGHGTVSADPTMIRDLAIPTRFVRRVRNPLP